MAGRNRNGTTPSAPGWNPEVAQKLAKTKTRSPKVSFNPRKFDDLVQNQGIPVKVFRTAPCPNVKSVDGQEHELDCPVCNGRMFVDLYPIETLAVFQNQTQDTEQFVEGLYQGSTVNVTFLQDVEIQYFTLVELCGFSDLFMERIKRQAGLVDILKYRGSRVNLVMDARGNTYQNDSDFTLNADGNLRWKPGKGPEPGSIFSINYNTSLRFRAIRAMHVNRFANVDDRKDRKAVKMNEQWMLQREFFVTREDSEGNILENKTRESDEFEYKENS